MFSVTGGIRSPDPDVGLWPDRSMSPSPHHNCGPRAVIGGQGLSVGLFALVLSSSGCAVPSARTAAEGWAADPLVPEFLLGETDGSPFGELGDIVEFQDGTLAVADNSHHTIYHLDPEGRLLTQWGRSGRGPAEFQRISRLWGQGRDSLLAYDFFSRRIAVIDRRLGFVAQHPVEPPHGSADYVQPIGATSLGYVLRGGPPIRPSDVPVTDRTPTTLYVMRADTLQSVLPGYLGVEAFRGPGRDIVQLPLGRSTLFFVAPDRVYSLDTEEDTIRVRSLSGTPLADIPLHISPRHLTDQQIQVDRKYRIAELHRQFAGQGVPADYLSARERAIEKAPYPATRPIASDLRVDGRGRIWLRRDISPALSPNQIWEVRDARGALLVRFELDRVERISVPTDNHFWAVLSDSTGLPQIARFAIPATALTAR